MPLGSSSLAPVISPGPSSCRKPSNPLLSAASRVVRPAGGLPPGARSDLFAPSEASLGWAPGLTTERIGSGVGWLRSGPGMGSYSTTITKHGHRHVPGILSSGHNLAIGAGL